jgi:MFS superfamily sulfate permease-like transporter
MVGNAIRQYDGILYGKMPGVNETSNVTNPDFLSDNPNEAKIMIAMTLALLAGGIQVLLGLLNAGFISKYLSDNLVEALTIGSSFLIVVSQVEYLLGIKYKSLKLPFRLLDVILTNIVCILVVDKVFQ